MEKQEKRWMKADEAAEYLSINLQTVYRLMLCRQLPALKLKGVGWRVDRRRLEAMMEREIEERERQWKDLLEPKKRRY
jgi:excisionase family DNA binding protein